MTALTPIQTAWRGYKFRSRLEARWAVFFENLGLQWEYEKEGFVLPSGRYYLPDFWIAGLGWFEIKPKPDDFDGQPYPNEDSLEQEFFSHADDAWENESAYQGQPGGVLYGTPGPVGDDWRLSSYAGCPCYDSPYYFTECPICRAINFEYGGRSERGTHAATCTRDSADSPYNPDSPRILKAAQAARSARFEHGERPR